MAFQRGGKVKAAVEGLIASLEEEITLKQEALEREIKSLTLGMETRKRELNQLRQQLHGLEQKWR